MVGYRDGVDWDIEHTMPGVLSAAGYQTAWVGRSMHQYPPEKLFGFEYMCSQEHRYASDYSKFIRKHRPDDWEGNLGTGVMHNDWTARPGISKKISIRRTGRSTKRCALFVTATPPGRSSSWYRFSPRIHHSHHLHSTWNAISEPACQIPLSAIGQRPRPMAG